MWYWSLFGSYLLSCGDSSYRQNYVDASFSYVSNLDSDSSSFYPAKCYPLLCYAYWPFSSQFHKGISLKIFQKKKVMKLISLCYWLRFWNNSKVNRFKEIICSLAKVFKLWSMPQQFLVVKIILSYFHFPVLNVISKWRQLSMTQIFNSWWCRIHDWLDKCMFCLCRANRRR